MKTILIVDDDRMFRHMYRANLAFYKDVRVEEAASGGEGLEKARALGPDLIVLDYKLPDLNGEEVSKRLKADPRTRAIPIALVSSHKDEADVGDAVYEIFLSKPVTDAKIRVLLQKFLGM